MIQLGENERCERVLRFVGSNFHRRWKELWEEETVGRSCGKTRQ